jgi:transcriptional regulator with GAF, ATPase, and Fis domain
MASVNMDRPGGNTGLSREHQIARTLVELADTLVDDFDLSDFLHMLVEHSVDLLGVAAAGVLLGDQRGGVRMAAASSERAELLEVFAAETDGGPCVECLRTGQPVTSTNLTTDAQRWPRYVAAAQECGFSAVQAVPMRLRRDVIGVLSLLNTHTHGTEQTTTDLGQALADVATIGILQQRSIKHSQELTEQLQTALNTRVIIEQAKGMLAASRLHTTPEQAFTALRGFARAHHVKLTVLAQDIVDGNADRDTILDHNT